MDGFLDVLLGDRVQTDNAAIERLGVLVVLLRAFPCPQRTNVCTPFASWLTETFFEVELSVVDIRCCERVGGETADKDDSEQVRSTFHVGCG